MSDAAASGAAAPGTRRPLGRRWVPFWILQVAEIVVAVVFVDISVHVNNGGLLVAGAAVLAALAVTARGPLGILRLVGRRLHLILVMAASALILVAPLVPALRPDIEGIIVIVFAAVGLIRLATLTSTDTVTSVGRARPGAGVIDASATGPSPMATDSPMDATSRTSTGTSRPVGATPAGSERADRAPASSIDAAGRWLGRTTGAAAASGKRVIEEHGPEANAKVKRSIRSAGRLTGRLAAPRPDPDSPPD